MVTGDDDKGFVVLGKRFQVLDEFAYCFVRVACGGHVVIHLLWNGRGEMNLFQFFGQFEGGMAGVGYQLHIDILSFLPDFFVFYLLAALCQERTFSGAFVRAERFCQFKIVIGYDGVGSEAIGYDTLVPGRHFVDGQQIVA